MHIFLQKASFLLFRKQILHGSREQMDLVVGTQGGLNKLFHDGYVKRNRVSTIALDEIDTLLDDTFKVEMMLENNDNQNILFRMI